MTTPLPDIACQSTRLPIPLDWVGMQGIAVPLRIASERVAAYADAGVSLDEADARGIHMSRLYLRLQEYSLPISSAYGSYRSHGSGCIYF